MFDRRVSFDSFIQAAREGNVDIINRYIEENRTNPAAFDTAGQYGDSDTALTWAAINGHTEVVRLLLAASAAFDTASHAGNTALICAASKGHTEVVRLLLADGAAFDTVNQYGNTALTCAAYNGRTEVVRLLLDACAAFDTAGQYGNTALILAADNGYTEVVSLLLAAGADPTLKNKKGETAEKLAKNDEIRSALREAIGTPEMKLEAFEKKRADLAKTQIRTEKDLQIKAQLEVKIEKAVSEKIEIQLTDEEIRIKVQLEKEKENMKRATALAFKSAIGGVSFLLEKGIENTDLLPEFIMCVSELMLSLSDERKELEIYSRALLKVAAKKGHGIARHIDDTFPANIELEEEIQIQEEMEINKMKIEKTSASTSSFSAEGREREIQARLKTFGSSYSSCPVSTPNHPQQAEKRLDDQMNVEFSSRNSK